MARLCYVVSPVNQLGTAITRERFTLDGDLRPDSLAAWLDQHAAKLGLSLSRRHGGAEAVQFDLQGPLALLDAFEVACLLGPADVWIESIERRPIGQD